MTISTSMKAEGFAKKIAEAKMAVYKTTNRFMPNWMLVSPDIMPILMFVPGFKAASNAKIANGPYVAGDIDNLKVIVTPALTEFGAKDAEGNNIKGKCILGLLGNDGKTGVGVFAPYMPELLRAA